MLLNKVDMSTNDTKYENIEKTLSAVGKSVFVNFYYDFKLKKLGHSHLAEKIYKENPRSISKNQNRRIYRAFHIFEINEEIKALEIIINSSKVPNEIKTKAKEILKKEIKQSCAEKDIYAEQKFLQEFNLNFSSEQKYEDPNPQKSKQKKEHVFNAYDRSVKEAKKAIKRAGFLCELSREHISFIRKNSTKRYTEPHHLVPIAASDDFPKINLDREQNIVSLCSDCHNKLHYGRDIEKDIKKLFLKRKKFLKSIGVNITYRKLVTYYK